MTRKTSMAALFVAVLTLGLTGVPATSSAQSSPPESLMWISHLDFLPGDPTVLTSFNAINSGVGGGLSGLIIESTTEGETTDGGNKVVEKGVQVPPGYLVKGVRVCYELSSAGSFISQIRLAQVQDPPDDAPVLLDDGMDLTDPGPTCVNSAPPFLGTIDPSAGGLRLSLRVNFGDTADKIVLRAVGLHLVLDPLSPLGVALEAIANLQNHTHDYLTGKGVGHNNTVASTGPPESSGTPPPAVTPPANNGNGGGNSGNGGGNNSQGNSRGRSKR